MQKSYAAFVLLLLCLSYSCSALQIKKATPPLHSVFTSISNNDVQVPNAGSLDFRCAPQENFSFSFSGYHDRTKGEIMRSRGVILLCIAAACLGGAIWAATKGAEAERIRTQNNNYHGGGSGDGYYLAIIPLGICVAALGAPGLFLTIKYSRSFYR